MKRLFFMAVGCLLLAATVVRADVTILQVSVSPQLLLQLYQAQQQNQALALPSGQLLMMAVRSDQAAAALLFRLEIKDKDTAVADAETFAARPLKPGMNQFQAGQFATQNLTVHVNRDYFSKLGTDPGKIVPTYTLRIIPVEPRGPVYETGLSLAPPSAQNQPPVAIFPVGVAVDTPLPVFSWTPVAKARGYEVVVGTDINPEVNVYWRSSRLTETQAIYPPSARILNNAEKYYWQVRAFDELGNPVGGTDGKSQPAWFMVNSGLAVSTAVAPADVDAAVRAAAAGQADFARLNGYQPVAVETTAEDLAGLLRDLRAGSAKVISARVE